MVVGLRRGGGWAWVAWAFVFHMSGVAHTQPKKESLEDLYWNRTALAGLENKGMAAVVLSFNHVKNVERIALHLKNEPGVSEIVVAEDGSTDGSKAAWERALRPQDSIAHTNDLHEIRAYNNAFRHIKNASVVCFLQDDDVPDDRGWASEVLQLFEDFRSERLGLISGLAAEICQVEVGEQQVEHPAAMNNPKKTNKIPYVYKPPSGGSVPFMFVSEAWLSPLCARVDVFRRLDGFDQTLAAPREPGIGLDIHLSLRAARAGFTVGVHGAEFHRGVGGHGTVSDPRKAALRLCKRTEISARIRAVLGCRWPPAALQRANLLNRKYLLPRNQKLINDIHSRCKSVTSRPCRFEPPRGPPIVPGQCLERIMHSPPT